VSSLPDPPAAGGSAGGPGGLVVTAVAGAAARAGLRAGDRIVAIDGEEPVDVLDLELAAADPTFVLDVWREGAVVTIEVSLDGVEDHGVELWNGIGVPLKTCANSCGFCFIDQVPAGLRPSLYVKDDDYRLSFLQGTFITLGNLSARDLERIARLRLSPLFVSLHAWDDDVRVALMGRGAARSRERLLALSAAGIELHLQVVLCPGVNDGPVLVETVRRLAAVDGVADVGVVPVSLSAASGGLRPVVTDDADTALEAVEALQAELAGRLRRRFVHAADEFYLLAGQRPPATDAPEQFENGVGICADFEAGAAEATVPAGAKAALLTGTLAAPIVSDVCRSLAGRDAQPAGTPSARPFVVSNATFGPHVTVTGLLGGRDVLRELGEQGLAEGEWLLAPRTFLPADLGRAIDDVTEQQVRDACHGRFAVGYDLPEAMAAMQARRLDNGH